MTTQTPSSSDDTTKSGLSRRTVSTAAAWTVPAIAVAVGAPMAAASGGGNVTFVQPTGAVKPGAPYPDIQVVATAGSGNITSPVPVTIVLPAGLHWTDGPGQSRTITIPAAASNTSSVVLSANGPLPGIAADATAPINTSFVIGGTEPDNVTVPTGWTNGPLVLSTLENAQGAGFSGNSWGQQNPYATFTFLDYVTPTEYNDKPRPVDYLNVGVKPIAMDAAGYAIMDDGTAAYGEGPGASKYVVVTPSVLLAGEKMVDVTLTGIVLTNTGRIIQLGSTVRAPGTVLYTPTLTSGFPTKIRASLNHFNSGTPTTDLYTLTSDGRVFQGTGLTTDIGVTGASDIAARDGGVLALTDGKVFAYGADTVVSAPDYLGGANAGNGHFVQTGSGPLTGVTSLGSFSGTQGQGAAIVNGQVYSWGPSTYWKHDPANQQTTRPVALPNVTATNLASSRGTTVSDITFGEASAIAILADGTVWGWGTNYGAFLGTGTGLVGGDGATPQQIFTKAGPALSATKFAVVNEFAVVTR